MKRSVILVSLLCTLLLSCSIDGYKIDGRFPDAPDGTVVYMSLFDEELTVVDSAVVENGKFEFAGDIQEPEIRMLFSYAAMCGGPVVLEQGRVKALLKDNLYRSGTYLNDDLQQFISDRDRVDYAMLCYNNAANGDDFINIAVVDSLRRMVDAAQIQFGETMPRLISKNIGNCLGVYLIMNSASSLSVDALSSLLPLVPERFRDKRYAMLADVVNNAVLSQERAAATSVGGVYVNFELPDIDGRNILFSNIVDNSRYTLLDFWASWCPPCRQEMPEIKKIYDEFGKKGLSVVSLSLDSDNGVWREAVASLAMNWTQLCEPSAGSAEVASAYGVETIPLLLLIDSKGRIIARSASAADIYDKLKELYR